MKQRQVMLPGYPKGFEATMIAKGSGLSGDAHFAMKQFGGNHSGSGASSQRWYDTGLRENGDVQLQWEGQYTPATMTLNYQTPNSS